MNVVSEIHIWSSLSGPCIVISDVDNGKIPREIARFFIPKELMGEMTIESLRYAYHNNLFTQNQLETMKEFAQLILNK